MVLPFPILADYAVLPVGDRLMYMTHGHKWGGDNPPPLSQGDILLQGHTHVSGVWEKEGFTLLNPGSLSIPKESTPRGYILLADGVFSFRHLDSGEEYAAYKA